MLYPRIAPPQTGPGLLRPSTFHPFTIAPRRMIEVFETARPVLRWAGGKQFLTNELKKLVHARMPLFARYHEPFLGGGSLFFGLDLVKPTTTGRPRACISDLNEWLVHTYRTLADHPEGIHDELQDMATQLKKEGKSYYYEVRTEYNAAIEAGTKDLRQAVRFIFLNRSNFNGIYRVNKRGLYNVPIGHTCTPYFPTLDHLRNAAQRLSNAEIHHCDFERAVERVEAGDLVYLDPPYPPLSKTANFQQYTTTPFAQAEQEKVARIAGELVQRGAHVIVSNSDVPFIRALYSEGFEALSTETKRLVSAKKKDLLKVAELILISRP